MSQASAKKGQEEKSTTFPQASCLKTLCHVMESMNGSTGVTTSRICDIMNFSSHRQCNYYTSSLVFLGLATCEGSGNNFKYKLTTDGVRVKRMNEKNKMLYIAEVSAKTPVFSKTYKGRNITKRDIERSGMHKMSAGTLERRMSTVKSWGRQLQATMGA